MLVNIQKGTIRYEEEIVLSNVNLQINPGDFVFLVGKTGSGKTSLLSSLYAQNNMDAKVAQVQNYNLLTIPRNKEHQLRKKIGFVFQDFKLLMDRNIYENLYFVLRATGWINSTEINQRIDSVLGFVGLEDIRHKMPYKLSRGQQQMVTIARSLLNDPELIIADEPSANLDPDTTVHIIEMLHKLTTKENPKGVMVATHQYFLINKFQPAKTFMCENGSFNEVILNQPI